MWSRSYLTANGSKVSDHFSRESFTVCLHGNDMRSTHFQAEKLCPWYTAARNQNHIKSFHTRYTYRTWFHLKIFVIDDNILYGSGFWLLCSMHGKLKAWSTTSAQPVKTTTDHRHKVLVLKERTNRFCRLISSKTLLLFFWTASLRAKMDRQMDGRYQTYYFPCFMIDNQ